MIPYFPETQYPVGWGSALIWKHVFLSGKAIPDDSVSDPIDVILKQDQAFGPERIDYDLWMTTLADPVRMMGEADMTGRMFHRAAAISQLMTIEAAARANGVTQIRTRILTHLQPTEDLSIVVSKRDLLSEKNVIISTSSVTWTLTRSQDEWLISQIFFEGHSYSIKPDLSA